MALQPFVWKVFANLSSNICRLFLLPAVPFPESSVGKGLQVQR